MLKMLSRLGKYWWFVVLLVIVTAGQAIFDCLLPTYLGKIISIIQSAQVYTDIDLNSIGINALLMIISAFLVIIFAAGNCKLAAFITAKMIAKTRYLFYKKVGDFSSNEINKFSIASLVTRTTNDLTLIGNTYVLIFRFIIFGPLLAIIAIVNLVIQNIWPLTVAIAVGVVLLVVIIVIIAVIVLPKYNEIQIQLDKVTLVTRENLEGLRVVRAYNAEDYQENKFEQVNDHLMKIDRFSNRTLGLLLPAIMFIFGLLTVAIYYISSFMITDPSVWKGFDFGTVTVVVEYASLILLGFVMICVVIVQLPRSIVCAKRVNAVLATNPDIVDGDGDVNETGVGTVEFKDVTFYYPGAEVPVLSHVSFKVEKGKTIAFIGATGAGKSTIINLLLRFFDPTEGEIFVDGVNIKHYKLQDLFKKFGYVPQRGYLFHDTLVNNITLGKPDATPVEIERALEISQSKEFVNKLPDGINYEISQGGKNVSGGQRQRLCIARAIMTNPEIFIFDDSFSALDYRTDKILRGEIKKQCAGVTNFIVAQRIGTIIDADEIVCLDAGKVMGIGTHKELLKNCPVYHEIALSQLSEEELENGGK